MLLDANAESSVRDPARTKKKKLDRLVELNVIEQVFASRFILFLRTDNDNLLADQKFP